MADQYQTEQESFWAGAFGDQYSTRNIGENWIAANIALFARVLTRTRDVESVMEFGANIGLNLQALRSLLPRAQLAGVEINQSAADALRAWGGCEVHTGSMLDFRPDRQWDFVLVKGVLIHINPDHLPAAYEALERTSRRYICVVEYYSPRPVTITYRGHSDRLFKRDFAGDILDRFQNVKLVDYGFCYHRDPHFPQDDVTWFLLEKADPAPPG
jgi:spore coat polysaccharide biosynthesis protein SpsF